MTITCVISCCLLLPIESETRRWLHCIETRRWPARCKVQGRNVPIAFLWVSISENLEGRRKLPIPWVSEWLSSFLSFCLYKIPQKLVPNFLDMRCLVGVVAIVEALANLGPIFLCLVTLHICGCFSCTSRPVCPDMYWAFPFYFVNRSQI